jgi:hypothetical protein
MYVVLRTNPDTSGGGSPYSYVRSFKDRDSAVQYAMEHREEEVGRHKSWASYYEVYKKI